MSPVCAHCDRRIVRARTVHGEGWMHEDSRSECCVIGDSSLLAEPKR